MTDDIKPLPKEWDSATAKAFGEALGKALQVVGAMATDFLNKRVERERRGDTGPKE